MRDIPWEKVLTAIRLCDAAGLRLLANESYNQQRELLQVFASIVENGAHTYPRSRDLQPRTAVSLIRNHFPAAGLPAQPCTCRTALYQADGYSIEVRLDPRRGSRRIGLSGQIANGHPGSRLKEMMVLLMSGKDLVARALSDELGGFHLQCAPARRLRLCVSLELPSKSLELPLGGLISRFLSHCGKTEGRRPAARAS